MEEYTDRGQTHVHEFAGSTFIAEQEEEEEPHNHRFAGMTSQVIPYGESHVHEILESTDLFEDHHHEVGVRTGLAISVGPNKHVHFVYGKTTVDDDHFHKFVFATQIEDPLVWND
jgi:hypothetical protein